LDPRDGGRGLAFEVVAKDLLGRIGKLHTKRGTVETPVLLPVVNPLIQPITAREMNESFGCTAIIANAYLLKKNFGDRVSDRGIHDFLGFDHTVVTDSGAYQILVYGGVEASQEEIIAYQESIDTDIGVILDIPTGGESTRERAEYSVEETLRRAKAAQDTITRRDILWVGPIQGGNHLDLVVRSAKKMAKLSFPVHALGSPTQVMEQYHFDYLVDMTIEAKRNLPVERPLHLFGAGHPFMFALAVAMGCDIFDSAAYAIYAREGKYMTDYGTERLAGLKYLPCTCRVCSQYTSMELASLEPEERMRALARHNLGVCFSEIRRVKQAIREGRLWELLELRAHSHPSLYQALKALGKYGNLLEENAPVTHCRGLFYFGSTGLARPEVVRHRRKMAAWSARPAQVLVMLPEPGSKPFHRSRELRRVRSVLRRRLGERARGLAFCVYAPPFGVTPLELDETYPLSQYEASSPLDVETRDYVAGEAARYIDLHGRRYGGVVVYASGELGRDVAGRLGGDDTSPGSVSVVANEGRTWSREALSALAERVEAVFPSSREYS
jgi:7-cyano-7-deazaguanine tRNA-ribosyltransferase